MEVSFSPVTTEQEQEALAKLADEIWHEYWPALIGEEQTDYMVDNFQSLAAIKRDMAENAYEYWFIVDGAGKTVGYTGGHEEPETSRFFISKIYLLAEERGKHYASQVIAFYTTLCRNRDLHSMYLTVNKHNDLGIRAYLGKGFVTIESVETDIGNGFVMDDYVMEKEA